MAWLRAICPPLPQVKFRVPEPDSTAEDSKWGQLFPSRGHYAASLMKHQLMGQLVCWNGESKGGTTTAPWQSAGPFEVMQVLFRDGLLELTCLPV